MGTATRRRGILTLYAMSGHIVAELQGGRYLELGVSYPVYFIVLVIRGHSLTAYAFVIV